MMLMKKMAPLVLMLVIFASACVTTGPTPKSDTANSQKFDGIIYKFVGEYTPLTELQKKEDWKQFQGTSIEGSGVIKEISAGLVRLEHPKNRYENGASISFRDSEKLSKLKIGDSIRFSGRLDDYSNSEGLIVGDAVFSQQS